MGGAQAQMAQAGSGMTMAPALSPPEEADLDAALIETYAKAGITNDPLTHGSPPPTINDLYDTLLHMGGSGPQLAQRLRKYTSGTFAGIFSQQSNVNVNNPMVVFNIRDLEDELRPVAMYIVLNYIWNKTKADRKRRLLIVDEAWQLMRYEDSANFMFSLAKRARKYNLGLTTITQDVEDFMASRMGRAIVANASMVFLLKQSPSAVDVLADIFKLTSEETKRLSQFPIGQGLFFAGQNHVHIQVIASPTETSLIANSPNAPPQEVDLDALARPAAVGVPPVNPLVTKPTPKPEDQPEPDAAPGQEPLQEESLQNPNPVIPPPTPITPVSSVPLATPQTQTATAGEVRLSHEG